MAPIIIATTRALIRSAFELWKFVEMILPIFTKFATEKSSGNSTNRDKNWSPIPLKKLKKIVGYKKVNIKVLDVDLVNVAASRITARYEIWDTNSTERILINLG